MTQLTTINRICEHLEKYVFDKIWNDPYSEYRTFFKPISLNTVAATGTFFGRYSTVQLPSKVEYKSDTRIFFYIYAIPANVFRTLRLNVTSWTQLDDFCEDNLIDLEFFCRYAHTSDTTPVVGKVYYTVIDGEESSVTFTKNEKFKDGVTYYEPSGRRVIRNAIFIKQSDRNDCILMAIERTAFTSCLGTGVNPDDQFGFGKYLDSDLTTSVRYECKRLASGDVPSNQKSGSPTDPITKSGTPTYTLYNGRLLTGNYEDYKSYLATGAFVENAYDDNIIGIFDVDACDGKHAYISESSQLRLLIHIPKEINPDHNIITPNTCDMYLVPTEMPEGTGYPEMSSVYLYQCGNEKHFHQLTHNDLSIDIAWLRELANTHGFTKYSVRIMVRDQGKTKKAIRDANYINMLYLHDDDEIVAFLLGTTTYNMPFWTAKHLESGMYSKALLKRRNTKPTATDQCDLCAVSDFCTKKPVTDQQCPSFSRRSLKDYIDIIGYYHTLALIGKRVTHFEIIQDKLGSKYKKDADGNYTILVTDQGPAVNEFVVHAPLALLDLQAIDYKAVVYHNGLRVDDSNIEIKTGVNAANQHHKEIEFTPDATFWTKVIDENYAQRLRVIVNNETFAVGDKVCIEIFDNRHDGRTEYIEVPEPTFTLTEDEAFQEGIRYYVKYNDKFVRAKIDDDLIGQPINGTKYDVGIRDVVYTVTKATAPVEGATYYVQDAAYVEGYRTATSSDFNADGSFKSGTTYYDRDASTVVEFSEFYEADDATLSKFVIPMVTTDEWKIYRINDEQDVPYEVTGDVKFISDRTYYALKEPNVFLEITNKDDLIDKPIDGVTKYTVTLSDGTTMETATFYELVEYYKVNNIAFYRIKDPGDFDETTKKLTLRDDLAGSKLMVVEGPLFFENSGTRDVNYTATGYMGEDIWKRPDLTHDNFPLDSEIVFLNNHRLIRGLDYTTEGYIPGDFCNGAKLYLQNVSYLEHDTKYQILRTCQSTLSNQRGYLKGDIIQWNHTNPFWFDELCIMTIDGKVCSNLKHDLGTLTITDLEHNNGTPFEFRMSVSTKIKNLVGNYGEDVDRERIALIKAYFDSRFRRPDFLTIVKKAHKIYSLYLEQIITAYVRDSGFTFVRHPTIIPFEEQFKMFTDWKRRDVSYNLSEEDMKYVDVYPIFNRLQMDDRYQYDQISYLVKQLRPTDQYKHKDADNVK